MMSENSLLAERSWPGLVAGFLLALEACVMKEREARLTSRSTMPPGEHAGCSGFTTAKSAMKRCSTEKKRVEEGGPVKWSSASSNGGLGRHGEVG